MTQSELHDRKYAAYHALNNLYTVIDKSIADDVCEKVCDYTEGILEAANEQIAGLKKLLDAYSSPELILGAREGGTPVEENIQPERAEAR